MSSPSTSKAGDASSTTWPSSSHSLRAGFGGRDAVRVHRRAAERLGGERDAQAPGRRADLVEERARGRRRDSRDRPARDRRSHRARRRCRARCARRRARPSTRPGSRRRRAPACCGCAWSSGRTGRSTTPGCGSSRRRRWRGRAAPCAPRPPPPSRRSSRRRCASRSHGLRVGPNSTGSVVALRPNSGVLVRPRIIRPARLCRRHDLGIRRRRGVGEEARAAGQRHAGLRAAQVLEQERHAGERRVAIERRAPRRAPRRRPW